MVDYESAVSEARRLVKRSEEDQWRLAELTWEQVEGGVSKWQWAKDIGSTDRHVLVLYRVWQRQANVDVGLRPSFVDAYRMADEGTEDPEEARQNVADRRARSAVRKASDEQKVEIAKELISDPEVREAVLTKVIEDHEEQDREHYQQWDRAYEEAREEVTEERSAHRWMLGMSQAITGIHHFSTDDVLSHASRTELQTWERDLDEAVPFLTELRQKVKARISGQLQVV